MMLQRYLKKTSLPHTIDIEKLEKKLKKYSIPILQDIIKEADKIAQKEEVPYINEKDISQARENCDWRYGKIKKEERKKLAQEEKQKELEKERKIDWANKRQQIIAQRRRNAVKKIIALGSVCATGLLYLYKKASEEEANFLKKKKFNEKEHKRNEIKYSLNDAYLWHMMNHNNFVMNQ